jgi:hypothetical protein
MGSGFLGTGNPHIIPGSWKRGTHLVPGYREPNNPHIIPGSLFLGTRNSYGFREVIYSIIYDETIKLYQSLERLVILHANSEDMYEDDIDRKSN